MSERKENNSLIVSERFLVKRPVITRGQCVRVDVLSAGSKGSSAGEVKLVGGKERHHKLSGPVIVNRSGLAQCTQWGKKKRSEGKKLKKGGAHLKSQVGRKSKGLVGKQTEREK